MQQASNTSIIISEILDSRTRNLVSVSRISDYVLSNELISMALASVAEDKQINRVLEELFAEEVLFHTASPVFYVLRNLTMSLIIVGDFTSQQRLTYLKNNFAFLERG
jgi:predicted DNA repair protein MutK